MSLISHVFITCKPRSRDQRVKLHNEFTCEHGVGFWLNYA